MRIGVTPYCHDCDINRPYLPDGYRFGVNARGAEIVVFYYTQSNEELLALLDTVDGFIFSGGPDVEPRLYGREKEEKCGAINPHRDEVELLLFKEIMKRDMPVLAICRGIQLVNVGLGGTLIQHVDDHRQHDCEYGHDVRVVPGTRLAELAGSKRVLVNTYHHQCIDDLGDGLVAAAYSDDGVIEAVERPSSRFFAAYQWHPEVILTRDHLANLIFDDFIHACDKT